MLRLQFRNNEVKKSFCYYFGAYFVDLDIYTWQHRWLRPFHCSEHRSRFCWDGWNWPVLDNRSMGRDVLAHKLAWMKWLWWRVPVSSAATGPKVAVGGMVPAYPNNKTYYLIHHCAQHVNAASPYWWLSSRRKTMTHPITSGAVPSMHAMHIVVRHVILLDLLKSI